MEIKERLREQVLKGLNDLTKKIRSNEMLPHGEQDPDFLLAVSESIEECLNNWYY